MTEPTTPPEVKPEEPKPQPTPETKPEESKPTVTFTPEQDAELNRRMAAARKDGEKDGERKAADAAAAVKKKADDDHALAEQEKAGEYETAKKTLTDERDTAVSERDALKADVDRYETAIIPLITALEKDIPDEGKKGYDDKAAALNRLNWLTERKELLVSLGTLSADGSNGKRPTMPTTPKPQGPVLPDDEAARKAHARQTLRSF